MFDAKQLKPFRLEDFSPLVRRDLETSPRAATCYPERHLMADYSKEFQYAGAIRNKNKRAYAFECVRALIRGEKFPDSKGSLSVMGAQAVRIHLRGLRSEK